MQEPKCLVQSGIIGFISIFLCIVHCGAATTVLENYVTTPDDEFEYSLAKTTYDDLFTTYIFDLTS
jgi:hypothetical protein